ncbi:MAG: hypothetical protein M3X11_05130 [Acidobacteriota bacterium]|nr:hypothetical protein [Acidobacteriota bacterium]
MAITLSLISDEMDNDDLQQLTRQLCGDLRDEAGVEASLATQESSPGAKGDLPAWGQIVIAAIGSGGALVALVNVLTAWVQRKKSLVLKFVKDGKTIEINAENQSAAEITALLKSLTADQKSIEGK